MGTHNSVHEVNGVHKSAATTPPSTKQVERKTRNRPDIPPILICEDDGSESGPGSGPGSDPGSGPGSRSPGSGTESEYQIIIDEDHEDKHRYMKIFEDGSKYEGEWKNDMMNGHGIRIYIDGIKYDGDFKNNKKEGYGIMTWPDGSKYEGDFRDDKKCGNGIKIWPHGIKYEGDWKNDVMDGYGLKTWPDGSKYEGNFKNDKRNGNGTETLPDGTKYRGEFKDDKRNGHGVKTWIDGTKYEGDFKDNKMNGHGVRTYQDGSQYDGIFKDDKKHGYGIEKCQDGTKYEGNFKDNQRYGFGIFTGIDGKRIYTMWKDNNMIQPIDGDLYVLMIGTTGKFVDNHSTQYVVVAKSMDTNVEQELGNKLNYTINLEETQDNYLYGVGKDLTNLQNYFIPIVNQNWNFYVGKMIKKEYTLKKIEELFDKCSSEFSTFLIVYTGYGSLETERNKGGYWIFHDGEIKFNEVVLKWKESKAFKENEMTRLVIVIDSCFSGCWIENWKEINDSNLKSRIIIQTSTKPHEVAKYTKYGGAFLCYWLRKQQDPNVKITISQTPYLTPDVDIVQISDKVSVFNGSSF